ncbi:MAG TPA: hypothetical protein DEP18_08095 [Flavobacteriales bacterium]|nr:hypothetical protein [Flavobacteriales bacterium]HRE73608.1 hypothetical protein [Flavobacteriales bacterium]HRE95337.1 hypothetical protein [Flavobacteriales bacterium]HRJ37259.1 hypothetical protein [Flavobacteriales bacterium]
MSIGIIFVFLGLAILLFIAGCVTLGYGLFSFWVAGFDRTVRAVSLITGALMLLFSGIFTLMVNGISDQGWDDENAYQTEITQTETKNSKRNRYDLNFKHRQIETLGVGDTIIAYDDINRFMENNLHSDSCIVVIEKIDFYSDPGMGGKPHLEYWLCRIIEPKNSNFAGVHLLIDYHDASVGYNYWYCHSKFIPLADYSLSFHIDDFGRQYDIEKTEFRKK